MEICASWCRYQCARSYIPYSTALLILSLILPTSFAQAPTTFSTSTIPSSTSTSVPTTTSSSPASTSSSATDSSTTDETSNTFNYYFLIIAAAVILVCFCVLYVGRQKRRKAALSHTRGQRALARDIEGWRVRFGGFGIGRTNTYHNQVSDTDTEDGLNERGEAPPPYVPGSKPPSIGSEELRRPSTAASSPAHAEAVEMSNVVVNSSPPGYYEHLNRGSQNGSTDITTPSPVITASERYNRVRRSTSPTERA